MNLWLPRVRVKSCKGVLQKEGYHDPVGLLLLSNFLSSLTKNACSVFSEAKVKDNAVGALFQFYFNESLSVH